MTFVITLVVGFCFRKAEATDVMTKEGSAPCAHKKARTSAGFFMSG
jgi:hypothetical protein